MKKNIKKHIEINTLKDNKYRDTTPTMDFYGENFKNMFEYVNEENLDFNNIPIVTNKSDIECFLNISVEKKNEILQYIKKRKIKPMSHMEDLTKQYFKFQGKYYIINEQKDANHLYEIISELNNWASLEYMLNKRQNLMETLKKKLETQEFLGENVRKNSDKFLIKNITDKKFTEICCQYINNFIKKTFIDVTTNDKNKKNELFLKTTFDINIGTIVAHCFIKEKIAQFIVDKGTQESYTIFNAIISHYNDPDHKKIPDLKHILQIEDSPNVKKILQVDHYNMTEKEIKILTYFLIKYLVRNNLWIEASLNFTINKHFFENLYHKKETITYAYEIGSILGDALISHNILEIAEKEDLTGLGNIKRYRLKNTIKSTVYSSATFSKPYLLQQQKIQDNFFTNENPDVILNLKEDTQTITESYHTKIIPNDYIQDLIEFSQSMPYQVYEEPFEDLIEYLKQFKSLYNDTTEEDKYKIILILYKIDIKILKQNNKDKNLVNKVIEVALKINENFLLKELQQSSKGNIAIYDAFNNIDATKRSLKGLFNDINIYKHFNYFYLGKHAASSGRLFTSCFFMSLQGTKIAEAFIINKKINNNINYTRLKELTRKYFQKNLPNTQEEFKNKNKELFRLYIQDKFKITENANSILENYPLRDNFTTQIQYLNTYCKKSKEILIMKSMITAYLTDNWEEMSYGKDATSSGTQIMSLINRMPELALLCNVAGYKKTDLYSMFGEPLTKEVTQVKIYIENVFKKIGLSLKEALNYKSIFILNKPKKTYNKRKVTKEQKKINDKLKKNDLKQQKESQLFNNELSIKHLFYEILHSGENKQTSLLISHYKKVINSDPTTTRDKLLILNTVTNIMSCWSFSEKNNNLSDCLLNLNQYFLVYKSTQEDFLPEAQLRDRTMFKTHAMTRPYSAGNKANIANFQKYLKEQAIEKGLDSIDPILLDLTPIILNKFFLYYSKIFLKDMDKFLDLCKKRIKQHCEDNADNVIPIQINYQFLNWNFVIYNRELKQVTKKKQSSHRPMLRIETPTYNMNQMQIKFPSIFIQGIDAQIVYYYLEFIRDYHHDAIPIAVWSNHDCFHIAGEYAMLLDIILQHIYCLLSTNTEFINNLYPDRTEFANFLHNNPPVVCTNPYFIKH